ncbi:heterokaryon incompatibility protein-domain-containing protein, partial [Cercophora newfieldiana]
MADYEYSPLSNGQIRLLSIDPALDPPDHPISCRLVTTELRTGLSYRALSYVWGPPHPEAEIRLDGHPVTVRANLAAILQAIRSTCRATYLWIDAICVNQKHNEEKAEQVAVMADIYYQAEEVLMWLGPSNETTKADMAMFRSV